MDPCIRIAWSAPLLALAGTAHAIDLDFDGNGAGAGTPGTGAWNTTLAHWHDGSGLRTWDNAALDTAVFGTPGTITLGSDVVAGGLQFTGAGNYTITGAGSLTMDGGRDLVLSDGAHVTASAPLTGGFHLRGATPNASTSFTISGNNAGIGTGVARVGDGARLVLANANALGSDRSAASLVLDDGAELRFGTNATYSNDYTLTGGTVRFGANASAGTFTGSPTLTAATTLAWTFGSQTWSGTLADTGAHVLSLEVRANEGFGPTLSGANTYSGDTTLVSGTLGLANAGALSSNSNLVFAGADPDSLPALGFRYGGTFARDLGTGAGQVHWTGSGGFRGFGQAVTVTLQGNAPLAWGRDGFGQDGASLLIGPGVTFTNAIDFGDAQRTLFGGGTLAGVLSGNGGLRVREDTLTVSAANDYRGDTVVDARNDNVFGASLQLGHANALPGGIGVTGGTSALVIETGTVVLTGASGDFLRGVGTGAHQVRFAGSGGFGAAGGVRTVNLGGAGETLRWNTGGFVPDGATLGFIATTNNARVDFRNGLDLAGGERRITVSATSLGDGVPGRAVHLLGVIENGSVAFSGFGEAWLGANNTYTGRTRIGTEASDATRVAVDRIADGGIASALGASSSDAANLVFGAGGSAYPALVYLGAGDSTDRDFTLAGNGELVASGTGALVWNGAPTVVSGSRTLRLGGKSEAINEFAGTLADGGGTLSVVKHGSGTWRLSGTSNTYTGRTSIGGSSAANVIGTGVLEVVRLGQAHEAGSLGVNASNNASQLQIFSRGVLRYVGTGETTNRNFSSATGETPGTGRNEGIALESSGSGALRWMGSVNLNGSVNPYFRLGGTNADHNVFGSTIANTSRAIALAKEGTGVWGLGAANTYTGNTELAGGVLRLDHAAALAGGLGAGDAAGTGIRFDGGVVGLTAESGDLHRSLGTTAGRNNLAWLATGDGGFAAYGGTRVVDIGDGAALRWAIGGFVANDRRLLLSHATSDATLDFRNAVDFNGAVRAIDVANGTHALDAIVAGTLSGTGASGLRKTGDGTLRIAGTNDYAGRSELLGGVVEIDRLGAVGDVGNLGLGATGPDALWIDGATLRYLGAGDVTDRGFTVGMRGATIDASGSGALAFDGAARATGLPATLTLTGSNTDGNRIGGVLDTSGTLSLAKTGAGHWTLAGDSQLARVDLHEGVLQLGAGGTSGSVGGATIHNAGTLVFDRSDVLHVGIVEGDGALVQRGTGTSVLHGAGSRARDVRIEHGALHVASSLTTPCIAIGDGELQVGGVVEAVEGGVTTLVGEAGTASRVTLGTGATFRVDGDLGDGDDALDMAGPATLIGAIALGEGHDRATLRTAPGTTYAIDGGAGDDRLAFAGIAFADTEFARATGFEHLVLEEAAQLSLASTLDFTTLGIDRSSQLIATTNARITGDVDTAGLVRTDASRLSVDGHWHARNGATLEVAVSPANGTSGGLAIAGDVAESTYVRFSSDGTPGIAPQTIRVIDAPGTEDASAFVAADIVRLQGSPFAWTFAHAPETKAWFLEAREDARVLPELPAFAIAPDLAAIAVADAQRRVFERLSTVRGDAPRCARDDDALAARPRDTLRGACRGAWMAAYANELDVGANPGIAHAGTGQGLLAGVDRVFRSRAGSEFRAGFVGGLLRGNHHTTGEASSERAIAGTARLRTTTPMVGAYASRTWHDGRFVDATLAAHRPRTHVRTHDGHADDVLGNGLALRVQGGQRRAAGAWILEPQLELGLSAQHWRDRYDAGGRDVVLTDDVLGTARLALRAERPFETREGRRIRPWASIAVSDTHGESREPLRVHAPDGDFALPGLSTGLRASVDLGFEATFAPGLQGFATLTSTHALAGTDFVQRQATAGLRWTW